MMLFYVNLLQPSNVHFLFKLPLKPLYLTQKIVVIFFSSDSAFQQDYHVHSHSPSLCLYLCVSQSGVICKLESHTFTFWVEQTKRWSSEGWAVCSLKPCQENLHTPRCSSPVLPESSFLWECKSLHYQTAANIVIFSVQGAISLPWVWKCVYLPRTMYFSVLIEN